MKVEIRVFHGTVTAKGFSGNATSATKLQTKRNIGLSGVTATAQSFDGSGNIIIPVTGVPTTLLKPTVLFDSKTSPIRFPTISAENSTCLVTKTGMQNIQNYAGRILRISYCYDFGDSSKGEGTVHQCTIFSTMNTVHLPLICGYSGDRDFMIASIEAYDLHTTSWKFELKSVKVFRNSDVIVEQRKEFAHNYSIYKIEIV